jgi:hypothetical protein
LLVGNILSNIGALTRTDAAILDNETERYGHRDIHLSQKLPTTETVREPGDFQLDHSQDGVIRIGKARSRSR